MSAYIVCYGRIGIQERCGQFFLVATGRGYLAVLVSALLGLLVGVSIELTWARGEFLETYMYAGFVAGLVTGGILYILRKGTEQRTHTERS